jgi:class 3 adenylate cyclase
MPVFLFTDIEGSTRLWEKHTADMGGVIARHDAILQGQIEACGGKVIKHTGHGVTAVFEAGEPVTCALTPASCCGRCRVWRRSCRRPPPTSRRRWRRGLCGSLLRLRILWGE